MERKTLVQRTVPLPVRKTFRWMNFHFSEKGRVINSLAKQLPEDQQKKVLEHGKNLTTAQSKKNLPRGFRNVLTSLIVGQCVWYFACPAFSEIARQNDLHPAITWIGGGGLDKLFLAADSHLFQTGGQSEVLTNQIVAAAPKTFAVGLAALTLELATDFSRCFIEYWSQKKYGLVADGAARLYGQTRPFPVRYSSFEAYQKIISYAIRPWAIGTPNQLFSSVYGILGSIWRTTIQIGLVVTVGTRIDNLFKRLSKITGLRKISDKIKNEAAEREKAAMQAIRKIVGEEKFASLQFRLAAESKSFWKWNPLKPALTWEDADNAAKVAVELGHLKEEVSVTSNDEIRRRLSESKARLEQIFGAKKLSKAPEYGHLNDMQDTQKSCQILLETVEFLQNEHELS